ncbi:hypothetical protein QRD02_11865, partial [Aequorivita sp. SDUM287046]|nr:hypothetical protein [Aequorivita aurantiaca]
VVTNIQNQGDIYNEIISIINSTTDIFVDNGDGTFTHTAADGTVVTFDANTLTFVNNGNGSYTFTNENGETITIDVIADVVTNIQNQGDIYNEIIQIYGSPLKSFVKCEARSPLTLGLVLLNGYKLARFTETVFDENNEFDVTNSVFTAKQDGIYSIFLQADSGGLISAAEFGVGIFKRANGSGVDELIAEERYLSININLGLLSIDVSPPTRSTETLVKLNAGDQIRFGTKVPLVNLQLLGSNQTHFTIHQVK